LPPKKLSRNGNYSLLIKFKTILQYVIVKRTYYVVTTKFFTTKHHVAFTWGVSCV